MTPLPSWPRVPVTVAFALIAVGLFGWTVLSAFGEAFGSLHSEGLRAVLLAGGVLAWVVGTRRARGYSRRSTPSSRRRTARSSSPMATSGSH